MKVLSSAFRLAVLGTLLVLSQGTAQSSSQPASPRLAPAQVAGLPCGGVMSGKAIRGDVLVRPGASCTLSNTSVSGNVHVQRGGALTVHNSNVEGSVTTEPQYGRLTLAGAIVGGHVDAAQGGGFGLDDSQVLGNVTVRGNAGAVRITRVTINGSLNCAGNAAAPVGSWIRVDGRQLGQCRRL